MQFVFTVCQVEDHRNILKLNPFAITTYKYFLESKKRSGTTLPASFSAWFFEEIYFSCYILLPEQISLPGCFYFVRYRVICVL